MSAAHQASTASGARLASHREVLRLAVPIMLSNLSTPLLGIVDTAVVGRIPDPAHVGAVALGALVFSFVFWGFGFLRMGTTGLTAQALGAADEREVRATLVRALLVAAGCGTVLVALQWPIRALAFTLLEGSDEVEALGRAYFDRRIFSAPATLTSYALLGWFVGLGRTGTALALQLVLNVTNMALDALFVLGLGWGVEGVALGTLAAEWTAAIVGVVVAFAALRQRGSHSVDWERVLDRERVKRTFAVSGDIMIRSLALVFVFVFFMAQGAAMGDLRLAANAVLLQFVDASAYFLDGLAFAAEALVGRAVGARSRPALLHAMRRTTLWAAGLAFVASALLFGFGDTFIRWMVVDPETREAAARFLPWAAAAPIAGVWCFQLDGIFIGATRTAEMRNAMVATLGLFLAAWWLLRPWGNHGLWAALHISYLARTVTLGAYLPRLTRLRHPGGAIPPSSPS